jgi:hypothetical protein
MAEGREKAGSEVHSAIILTTHVWTGGGRVEAHELGDGFLT